MINYSIGIRNWTRIVDVGGALSLACSQAITTGALSPNVISGGSGAGPESEESTTNSSVSRANRL